MSSLFKVCPDCGVERPITEFGRNAARPDGLQFYCKQCYSVRSARTYRERQERKGRTVRVRASVPAGHKQCPGCDRVLAHSHWHRNKRSRDGLASYCKDCRKDQSRADYLRRTFGLTPEQVDAMVAEQGGVCAICGQGKPQHIDHDHRSGRVRGVLCGPCNMGLGLFGDDPMRLHAAVRYLSGTATAARPKPVDVVYPDRFRAELASGHHHAA